MCYTRRMTNFEIFTKGAIVVDTTREFWATFKVTQLRVTGSGEFHSAFLMSTDGGWDRTVYAAPQNEYQRADRYVSLAEATEGDVGCNGVECCDAE